MGESLGPQEMGQHAVRSWMDVRMEPDPRDCRQGPRLQDWNSGQPANTAWAPARDRAWVLEAGWGATQGV